jgi:tetratricopeptide (TPR) repeat protein
MKDIGHKMIFMMSKKLGFCQAQHLIVYSLHKHQNTIRMKKLLIILSAALLLACNPTAKLPVIKSDADAAFESADYEKAYTLYSNYIDLAKANNVAIENDMIVKLAQACTQTDRTDEAIVLYEQLLQNDQNIHLLAEYAQMLQRDGKANEELALWNKYSSSIRTAELKKLRIERLIFLNASNENYPAIVTLFERKGSIQLSKEAQLACVNALANSKQTDLAVRTCNSLLKENPDYIEALEWKAKYYYHKADERYKYEMAKYNKKKNATTYAYLRRDLKKVSADFRIARDTLIKLRQLDPSNKSYIRYLKNTYLRLDQKDKAAKLEKLLK